MSNSKKTIPKWYNLYYN